MLSRLIRLLTLLAVVALPLGMAHAGAMPHGTGEPMAMTTGHCDDMARPDPAHPAQSMPAQCDMACASALPAIAPPKRGDSHRHARSGHGMPASVRTLTGLVIEIATPPPRFS